MREQRIELPYGTYWYITAAEPEKGREVAYWASFTALEFKTERGSLEITGTASLCKVTQWVAKPPKWLPAWLNRLNRRTLWRIDDKWSRLRGWSNYNHEDIRSEGLKQGILIQPHAVRELFERADRELDEMYAKLGAQILARPQLVRDAA